MLGERTIWLDCDVIQADGGTRTASITGSFVALALALDKLGLRGTAGKPVLRDQVAAISVGLYDGELLVDLDYAEDHQARVDMNVVATATGQLVEVQATAEGKAVEQAMFLDMLAKALGAIDSLVAAQRAALAAAGVELARLLGPSS
jgi:ribonuclease PH